MISNTSHLRRRPVGDQARWFTAAHDRALPTSLLAAALLCSLTPFGDAWWAAGPGAAAADEPRGVGSAIGASGKRYLTYDGQPLLAFGPGDEMRLLSGGGDTLRWAAWQKANGMNLLRGYPTSVPIENYGRPGLAPFIQTDHGWDVDRWNEKYFEHFAETVRILEEHDIVLHLQLWQIVWFKGGSARWEVNYLNPKNNINDWTKAFRRGQDYIDAPAGSRASEHQKAWVWKILDSVKDRHNVWLDCINELGNEMGTLPWATEVVGWIREWEELNGRTWLVGVDSEHHYRPEVFGPVADKFDLIILNELRNPEHARQAIAAFGLPAVTVRSSDARNQPADYVFTRAEQTAAEHQTRYRTLCYRSLFAGVQSIGAYWKMEIDQADYQALEFWPTYARRLRNFWEIVGPHWPNLEPANDRIVGDSVTPHAYALASHDLLVVYLECGPKSYNNAYPSSELTLELPFAAARFELFDPRREAAAVGREQLEARRVQGRWQVQLPAFTDDVVLFAWPE